MDHIRDHTYGMRIGHAFNNEAVLTGDMLDQAYQEGRRIALALRHEIDYAEDVDEHLLDEAYQEGRVIALHVKHDAVPTEARPINAKDGTNSVVKLLLSVVIFTCPGTEDSQATTTAGNSQPRVFAQEEFDRNMERLSMTSGSFHTDVPAVPLQSSSSWSLRQLTAQEQWKEARPDHLQYLLATEAVGQELCSICHQAAVIRCRDCLPEEWLCEACDVLHHKRWPLHNRDSVVDGFLKAIPPSTCYTKGETGHYISHKQASILPTVRAPQLCSCEVADVTMSPGREVILITINDLIKSGYWPASSHSQTLYTIDLFHSFQDLKSGQINGDALQRSFLEFSYCSFEEDQLCCATPFTCPACTPEMVAVAADGNRKLYRFKRSSGFENTAFFEGLFLAKDSKVSAFVDTIRTAVKSTQGKATCGASQWAAARETSRRASKLDEEGVEVAVCRHGYLLKGLNMYRGEMFAYPLYLQREIQATANVKFFAMDVTCKYWPYLQKVVAALPPLQGLLQMRPFLSIMHARAHATKCELKWSGRNQEGAGTTAGEEVEQVNSYLSRCALTTKYMSKAARVDMLTVHAMEWNRHKGDNLHKALSTRYVKTCQRAVEETARLLELREEVHCSEEMALQWVMDVQEWAGETTDAASDQRSLQQQSIEGLHLSLHHRKQSLYRQNDSNKLRHRLRKNLAKDKRRLFEQIAEYNRLVSEMQINVAVVERV
ncbi:uncharacterized protein LOC130131969 [Lampris incognitus]|uniref:uncharacterized protein LOC130123854 n=1 Tax=Lampris incognitus TaxID=2546036 RepID=UPI0024B4E3DF|nr:uncharacterized protein LOC130123854 [Lampris incognitus]XP_056157671.1 uncharacterized protein LOC130131969 [Lampris incognitus]